MNIIQNQFIFANDYGFFPHNSGNTNSDILQSLVMHGGTIYILNQGIYNLSKTILLTNNTSLYFASGVYIRRCFNSSNGHVLTYSFMNQGAYTKTWNENINIYGLNIIGNNVGVINSPNKNGLIVGLRGVVSFFYAKNIIIKDYVQLDLDANCFGIHICTFENVMIENVHIEGQKDAIHFGKGNNFSIRHGIFRTFDDPIALNAHDYSTSNPQLGWIENGIIEDCVELNLEKKVGFFCRILGGAWTEWYQGMKVRHSDSVLSNGRLYRVVMNPDIKQYVSNNQPNHTSGMKQIDGINWVMVQDDDPILLCGCKNIHFRNIVLKSNRLYAFSFHLDNDQYSHSYYPFSPIPIHQNLIFENISVWAHIPYLFSVVSPVNEIKLINSNIGSSSIRFHSLKIPGLYYPSTSILISGCHIKATPIRQFISSDRNITLKMVANIIEDSNHSLVVSHNINVRFSDVDIQYN